MTARFEKFDDEFLKFDRIPAERRLSNRPDLHAFLLLDRLMPGTSDMVSAAEHDEIWLDVDTEELDAKVSDEELMDLIRCGVRYHDEYESLCLFV